MCVYEIKDEVKIFLADVYSVIRHTYVFTEECYNVALTSFSQEVGRMKNEVVRKYGPTWFEVLTTLAGFERVFGGSFVVEMFSAAALGVGGAKGGWVRLIWRKNHNGRVIDYRASGGPFPNPEFASLPIFLMHLAGKLKSMIEKEDLGREPQCPHHNELENPE